MSFPVDLPDFPHPSSHDQYLRLWLATHGVESVELSPSMSGNRPGTKVLLWCDRQAGRERRAPGDELPSS